MRKIVRFNRKEAQDLAAKANFMLRSHTLLCIERM